MLRITRSEAQGEAAQIRLGLEGRIVGPWVAELRAVVNGALAGPAPVELDLTAVEFVDSSGMQLLLELARRGVEPCNATGYVAELLRSSEREWERTVRECAPRLLGLARRLLESTAEAREVVRAAFAAEVLPMPLKRHVVQAALARIAARGTSAPATIEDLLPRFEREGRRLDVRDGWDPAGDGPADEATRWTVRECIEKLPALDRILLLLRDVEEVPANEVAELVSLAPSEVHVRLHRARQALKTLVGRALVARAPLAFRDPVRDAGALRLRCWAERQAI